MIILSLTFKLSILKEPKQYNIVDHQSSIN